MRQCALGHLQIPTGEHGRAKECGRSNGNGRVLRYLKLPYTFSLCYPLAEMQYGLKLGTFGRPPFPGNSTLRFRSQEKVRCGSSMLHPILIHLKDPRGIQSLASQLNPVMQMGSDLTPKETNFLKLKKERRWEGGSCLGSHVHPWWIHVNVWQNQYSIVK